MARIVILDGFTLNPGDLDWSPVRSLGQCEIYERTPDSEIIQRCGDAEIVLTNKEPFSRETILALPHLKYIGVTATGYNIVDVAAAKERGIVVTNVRNYGTPAVAQTVFALLLELTHRAGLHSEAVGAGEWSRCPDFCFWKTPLVELSGKTFGLVGYGEIGQAAAQIARAFGMNVLALVRTPRTEPGATFTTSLEELARSSDVISLHCPLTPETQGLFGSETLSWMKPSAFLINTARGPLVDEAALADALNSGRIAGAGLDVLAEEPPPAGNPLLTAKNCVITPHYAWATREARARLMDGVVENLKAYLAGKPINVVNG